MGRLFWRFFAIFALSQLVTIAGVTLAFWVKTSSLSQRHMGPPSPDGFYLDAMAATLQTAGREGATRLIGSWQTRGGAPTVLVVNAQGVDILARNVPSFEQGRPAQEGEPVPFETPRRVVSSDGDAFEILAMHGGIDGGRGRPPGGPRSPLSHFPVEPFLTGMLVSLAFGAMLAWNFSRPIRNMREAFDEASGGSLSVRLGPKMRRRRDEFADLARDFDHMVERIEVLMDGQRRLLHDVSHELRSPLARLQLAVGLARQQPERVSATLDRVDREAQRMDALIDELLTLSRLEAGVIGALDEDVQVFDLIEGIVADARFEANAAGRNIIFAHGPPAAVKGRAELLHRAIENVVRNAVTHTDANTNVFVDARADREGTVWITVDDEGPGIPGEYLAFIFRPFFRAQGQQGTPARRGHGLGLAIAQRIIDAHGGVITAANRGGRGLRVEISLPARMADVVAA